MITASADTRAVRRLLKRSMTAIRAGGRDALEQSARHVRDELIRRARTVSRGQRERVKWTGKDGDTRSVSAQAGITYDGRPIPLNAESTVRRKAWRGTAGRGRVLSLLDRGILLSARLWTIRREGDQRVVLSVPPARRHVLPKLRKRGYRWFGVPVTIKGLSTQLYVDRLAYRAISKRLQQLRGGT